MKREIEDIITDWLSGEKLGKEELQQLNQWCSEARHHKEFDQLQRIQAAVRAGESTVDTANAWQKFMATHQPRLQLRKLLQYAALLLLPLCAGLSWFFIHNPENSQASSSVAMISQPEDKQIILTLSDGQQMVLNNSKQDSSILVQEQGAVISQQGNNLAYQSTNGSDIMTLNTITIPTGCEYLLILADGTQVWLNADTRLTYPVSFNEKQREVTLEGEAYFQVAKNESQPFIVKTQHFNIRVTGTQFNVRTYPNDIESATLAEGKIQLEQANQITPLLPGEQATLNGSQLNIRTVDLDEAIAWRQNAFYFKQRKLESIMNDLARWYNTDVFYQHQETKNYHFTAWFSRNSSISEVIQILEKTNKIKIDQQGNTLIVKANNQ